MNYFKVLIIRIHCAALSLIDLDVGKPLLLLCREYTTTISEIEAFLSSTKLMAGKIQKFCAEIGWTVAERIINNFKSKLSLGKKGDSV
jgi:hypothetical protein